MATPQMSIGARMQQMKENPDTANVGKKWTNEENDELMKLVMAKTSVDDMAKVHKRTPNSIQQQVLKLASKMVSDTKTVDEAAKEVNVQPEELTAYIAKVDRKSQRKQENVAKNNPEETHLTLLRKQNELLATIAEHLRIMSLK